MEHFMIYNDKIANVSFKELKERLTAEHHFKDFNHDSTIPSTSKPQKQ